MSKNSEKILEIFRDEKIKPNDMLMYQVVLNRWEKRKQKIGDLNDGLSELENMGYIKRREGESFIYLTKEGFDEINATIAKLQKNGRFLIATVSGFLALALITDFIVPDPEYVVKDRDYRVLACNTLGNFDEIIDSPEENEYFQRVRKALADHPEAYGRYLVSDEATKKSLEFLKRKEAELVQNGSCIYLDVGSKVKLFYGPPSDRNDGTELVKIEYKSKEYWTHWGNLVIASKAPA